LSAILLDTHAWAWLLSNDARLSPAARHSATAADVVWLSPISFYEIVQKVRLGKWPEMARASDTLPILLKRQGGKLANLTGVVAMRAAQLDWPHRDPFDRLIAATAMELGVRLVSADTVFDDLKSSGDWRGRVW